jgi:hypothetical protein
MTKKYLLLLFLFAFTKSFNAQVGLSVYSEVSIITAGPGSELYEAFGHSAIRIKDPVLRLDLIYNYGMFDFNVPNFYTNFAKGNMVYSLARYDFKYFLATYKRDKRWVKQQVLNLTQQERQAFFMYLENNALPENRDYNYDPYFNNCATKLRDITKSILGDKLAFKDNSLKNDLTFRDLTNNEIHWNNWGSLGLNLIAGINLDKKLSSEEYMFLPDYVYSSYKNASVFIKNEPKKLVKREDILLNFKEKKAEISIFNPLFILSIIALFGIFITYKDFKNNTRSKYLDFTILFFTGLIGVFLVFLWFFSTHSTAPNNFNVLWAFPINLIIAFLILKKNQPKWLNHYFKFLFFLLIFIPILWIVKVQIFPIAIIPFLILLFIRYLFLSKTLK